ncbi:VpsP family polysaccharide biosynthesis protein [Pseudoalteromonas mariniglutinosa]|uniref:VpsP family polysaccharide biosynthesis protein n=1 Tax=Pseudoalteromonas mariniglutinosa TaxID=206042 RepID=UPI003851358C
MASFIIYFSANTLRANAWYFHARNNIQQHTSSLNIIELLNAKEAITTALALDPKQAHYLHMLAYLELRHYEYLITSNEERQFEFEQLTILSAETAIKRSVALRATWAESWLLLAHIASLKDGANEGVYYYLQKAKAVGPYQFKVHLAVIQIALANWQHLSPDFKQFYVNELILAARHDHKFGYVFTVAEELNKLPTLCLSLLFGKSFEKIKRRYIYKKSCK